GNFVGQQGDVHWRDPRHRGLARARHARKQISPAIANRAGGVQQKSTALGQPLVAVNIAADPNVVIGNRSRAGEIELQLKLGTRRTQEPRIALAQQIEKALVASGQGNRNSSDLDTRGVSGRSHYKIPGSAVRAES